MFGMSYTSCLCATNAGRATTETIEVLTRWEANALEYKGRIALVQFFMIAGSIVLTCGIGCWIGLVISRCSRQCRDRQVESAEPKEGSTRRRDRLKVIEDAQSAGSRLRGRVKLVLFASGGLSCAVALSPLMRFAFISNFKDDTIPPFPLWIGWLGPGGALALMGIFPTDVVTIRVGCYVMFAASFLFCAMQASFSSPWEPNSDKRLEAYVYGCNSILGFTCMVMLSPALSLDCCCGDIAMAPRVALARLWIAFRFLMFLFGTAISAFPIRSFTTKEAQYTFRYSTTQTVYFMILSLWASALFTTRRNRGRVQRVLLQLGAKGTVEQEASAIAALIGGGGSAKAALSQGTARFRALPLDDLTEDDLRSSGDSGLFAKTSQATLGEVHGFLSHSWHDDAAFKYAALQRWRTPFIEQEITPLLWLGKHKGRFRMRPAVSFAHPEVSGA